MFRSGHFSQATSLLRTSSHVDNKAAGRPTRSCLSAHLPVRKSISSSCRLPALRPLNDVISARNIEDRQQQQQQRQRQRSGAELPPEQPADM